MILLLASPALAAASPLVCDYGDSLASIIGLARREEGPEVVITITEGECVYDLDEIVLEPSSYGGTDFTIRPTSTAGTVPLPPVAVKNGATLRLERVEIDGVSSNLGIREVGGDLFDLLPGAAIYADGADLVLSEVSLVGSTGAGVVVVDASVEITDTIWTGFAERRPLFAVSDAAPTTVTIAGSELSDNAAGGILLYKVASSLELTVDGTTFASNGPASGADILAYNARSTTITDSTFQGSAGSGSIATAAGAPVYVTGGSMSCSGCTFSDTTGSYAATFSAFLSSGQSLEIEDSVIAPASSAVPVLWADTGGTVTIDRSRFLSAGELTRYAGTTTIRSSRFEGEGASMSRSAIKLSSTSATLEGLTLCGYRSASFGLIAAYGSTVSLTESVAQDVQIEGDPILKAYANPGSTRLTVRDNTLTASRAALVGGEVVSLEVVNNLVAGADAGIAVASVPSGATLGYNLWYDVTDPGVGGSPEATDVIDAEPRFVTGYDPLDCGTAPWITQLSPANGAGDPGEADIYGNMPSDIGAIDYDDEGGGDTGDTDTGDSGVVTPDTGDTAIDTAPGDDSGVDTDKPALVGGALPPCGCDGGGGAVFLAILGSTIARRRRA